MSRPNPTYQDIANYTGFSKTTISRYFNRPDTVTPKNRAKIRHALEVLDYKSNKVARILAKGQTEFIGLVVPNLYLSFYGEILDQFLKTGAISKEQYEKSLHDLTEKMGEEQKK